MGVAIIIGHNSKAKGAFSGFLNTTEFELYKSMVNELAKIGDVYFHNENISGYNARMIDTAQRINKTNYTMVLALHFNSAESSQANGTEALYLSEKGRVIAKNFNALMVKEMGYRNRGEIKLNPTSRGYAEILHPKAPAVILEPFFGSNEMDCKKFDKNKFLEVLKCL